MTENALDVMLKRSVKLITDICNTDPKANWNTELVTDQPKLGQNRGKIKNTY